MGSKSFYRKCKHCGRLIQFRRMPHGRFVAFEGYDTIHDCNKRPALPRRPNPSVVTTRTQTTLEDIGFEQINVRPAPQQPKAAPQAIGGDPVTSTTEFLVITCPNPTCRKKNRTPKAMLSQAICGKCKTPLQPVVDSNRQSGPSSSKIDAHPVGALSKDQTLLLAIQAHRVVRIIYRDRNHETTTRQIEPMVDNGTRFHAYCRLRQDFRDFRFDGVKKAELLEEIFVTRPEPRPPYFTDARERSQNWSVPPWVWLGASIFFLLWLFGR